MQALLNLKRNKGAVTKRKRVGRGNASHGSSCGRGENGQKSRTGGNIRPGFTGGDTPLIKRMPKLKGFKNPNRQAFQVINLDKLNYFNDNDTVNIEVLFAKNLISKKTVPVKLLGNGEVSKKLKVELNAISKSAQSKIEAAGGKVITPTVSTEESTAKVAKEAKAKKGDKK